MEKIKFKTSVVNIWLGIFFLIVAVLFECVAIWGFREDGSDEIILMVLITIFFVYVYPVTSQDVPLLIAFFIGYFVVFGGLFVLGLWLYKKGKEDISMI